MNHTTLLAIDIAKNIFQLHGIDSRGKATLRKRISRKKLSEYIEKLPKCKIIMEACGGANYWSRRFTAMGHEVKLIGPQFVKPFVKGNKTDRNDAEAIAEAASRPSMRFVCVKNVYQQDLQSLHRIRERIVSNRTQLTNQIRGLLLEYGIAIPQGHAKLRKHMVDILENEENELSLLMREEIRNLYKEFLQLTEKIKSYDKRLEAISKQNEDCQRIMKLPGVGVMIATAIVSDLCQPNVFKNGRHFAAYLGLVPKQKSSGGKSQLLGISKRGDRYIRMLLIHGARAVLRHAANKTDGKIQWLNALRERRGFNRAIVALANKKARVIWSLLANKSEYQEGYNAF